jgi:hypothetical protein
MLTHADADVCVCIHTDKADTADANGEYVVRAPRYLSASLIACVAYGLKQALTLTAGRLLLLYAHVFNMFLNMRYLL